MAGRTGAERIPRQQRHTLLQQQALGEGLGTKAGGTDVEHDEHAARRSMGVHPRAVRQGRTDSVTQLLVGLAHRPHGRQLMLQRHLHNRHHKFQ